MATNTEPYGLTPLRTEDLASLGHPLSLSDFNVDAQGRPWRIIRGQKTYYAPQWFDQSGTFTGYKTQPGDPTGQDEGFFHRGVKWNWETGQWENPVNWANVIGTSAAAGVGGAIAAPYIAGALGGGGATAPAGGAAGGGAGAGAEAAGAGASAWGPYAGGYAGLDTIGATAPTVPSALAAGGGGMTWQQIASGLGTGQGAYGWLGPAINAGLNLYGQNKAINAQQDASSQQLEATKYATDAQQKANENQLAFLKQQAAYDALTGETNRAANYDQWAAKQELLGSVGQALGLPARRIPAYVPLPANPYNVTSPTGNGTPTGTAPPTGTPAAGGGDIRQQVAAYFAQRGATPLPTSLDSWQGYWDQWGKNDPEYFNRRLAAADEFRGTTGPLPTIGAPAPTAPPPVTAPPSNRYRPLTTVGDYLT